MNLMLRKVLVAALGILGILPWAAFSKDVMVKGYTRKDGTIVGPHMRSGPNSSTLDNFSTKGNINPYTGEAGTVNPSGNTGKSNYSRTRLRSGGNSASRSRSYYQSKSNSSTSRFYGGAGGLDASPGAAYFESADCSPLVSEMNAISKGKEVIIASSTCLMHFKPLP